MVLLLFLDLRLTFLADALGENGDEQALHERQGSCGHKHVSMNINKWAKPTPKLEMPPKVHLQKASKIKQICELWSMNVALAMSIGTMWL